MPVAEAWEDDRDATRAGCSESSQKLLFLMAGRAACHLHVELGLAWITCGLPDGWPSMRLLVDTS